jgi:hypothetical protein
MPAVPVKDHLEGWDVRSGKIAPARSPLSRGSFREGDGRGGQGVRPYPAAARPASSTSTPISRAVLTGFGTCSE